MNNQDVTYQEKLNELRLDIPHPNNVGQIFILVEGESDIKLYRKLFDTDSIVNVEQVPGGSNGVETAVHTLLQMSSLIIGIRDADFIRLLGTNYQEDPIFLTDAHDVEMMMMKDNEVLKNLLNEYDF